MQCTGIVYNSVVLNNTYSFSSNCSLCICAHAATCIQLQLYTSCSMSNLYTILATHRYSDGISSLVSLAAACLQHPDGHLYYLGADTFGALGYTHTIKMA